MTTEQIAHLKGLGYLNTEKVAPIPPFLVEKAESRVGFASTVIPFSDPQSSTVFPGCTHLAYVPWLKTQGLWSDYQAYLEGAEEEEMDISFATRLDQAKDISDEQNGVEKAVAPLTVPSVPKNIEAETETVVEVRFDRYVERLKYVKEQGYEHVVSVSGYVKNGNRFIDSNIIKNFDAPADKVDAEWTSFVQQRSEIEWENPLESKKETEVEKVPDVTAEILEEQVPEKVTDVVENETNVPEKETEALTSAQQDNIIQQRMEYLKESGFVQNKQTYMFERGDWQISSRLLRDLDEKGNKAWSNLVQQIKETLAEELETTKVVQAEKEVEEISTEDVEAAAEKMDELVAEKDNEIPPFVEEEKSVKKRAKANKSKAKENVDTTDADISAGPKEDNILKCSVPQADLGLSAKMDFAAKLKNVMEDYSSFAFTIAQIKSVLESEIGNDEKIELINDFINDLI